MKQLTIDERLNRIEDIIINDPFFGNKSPAAGTADTSSITIQRTS